MDSFDICDDIGIAVVGYGYWGRNHARVFNELAGARLVAVCDGRGQQLAEAGTRFPKAKVTPSLSELLSWPDIDAVVIATPATTHFDVTGPCLEAGKHVLVEKPFTVEAGHGELLLRQAEGAGLTLMVGQTFLYNPGIAKLKELVGGGGIGRTHYMYARRTNLGPIRDDVNALWDLAPHDVAIFNHLTDAQPLWVSAVGSRVLRQQREDVGFISLAYPDNVLGHVHVSWTDPSKVREVVVVGSQQRVLFNDLDTQEPVRIFEKGVEAVEAAESSPALGYGEQQLLVRDGDIRSPRIAPEEPLKRQSAEFLDCIRTGARPLSGGSEGVGVVLAMEAIEESLARRGAPVELRRSPQVAIGALQ